MAGKNFTNKSKNDMNVTLLIRQGEDVDKPSLEQTFSLNVGETKFVKSGDTNNIYLNGLVLAYEDAEDRSMVLSQQKVLNRGSAPTFDWVLNTYGYITINITNGLNISSSN